MRRSPKAMAAALVQSIDANDVFILATGPHERHAVALLSDMGLVSVVGSSYRLTITGHAYLEEVMTDRTDMISHPNFLDVPLKTKSWAVDMLWEVTQELKRLMNEEEPR